MGAVMSVSIVLNVLLLFALLVRREARGQSEGVSEGDAGSGIRRPKFRRFVVNRRVDVTGISGTGIRVEGVVFSDGWAVTHWLDLPPMSEPKTEVWHNPGVDPFIKISGHNGASEVVWIDSA
jgi:hypothetical protein